MRGRGRRGGGAGRGRQPGGLPLGKFGIVSDDVERMRLVSKATPSYHPDGIALSTEPDGSSSLEDAPEGWRRTLAWERADGHRAAYVHQYGDDEPWAYSTIQLVAKHFTKELADIEPAHARIEAYAGEFGDVSEVRVDVHNANGGSSGTHTLLRNDKRSHWVRDRDNGSSIMEGKLHGCAGYWNFSMFADGNFRFYGAAKNTFVDPDGMLQNDGVINVPVTGTYILVWGVHTTTGGEWQFYPFLNSGALLGAAGDVSSGSYYGNDGIGVGAYGVEVRRFTGGDHIRIGGWHTGGGNNVVRGALLRLPV